MMLTVKEVAQRLNVSPSCIYQLVESGKLPHHRIGLGRGAIRFSDNDVAEYLEVVRQISTGHRPKPASVDRRKLKHLKL